MFFGDETLSPNNIAQHLLNLMPSGPSFWDKNKRPKYQGVAHSHSVPRDGEVSEDKDVAKALMPTWCPEVRKGSERLFSVTLAASFFFLPGIMEKLPVEKLWILSCKNAHKT